MAETLTALRSIGQLQDFTSFYELFAALNIAYAGSESFKVIIDNRILKIYKANPQFDKDLETLKEMANISTLIVKEDSSNRTSPISKVFNKRIEIFTAAFNKGLLELEEKKCAAEEFIKGFNCMFLITSLYCIFMIAVAGYAQFIQPLTIFCLIVFLQFSLVFNAFVFGKSFSKYKSNDINPLITITCFIAFLLAGISFANCPYTSSILKYTNIKGVYIMGMALAVSPYLIHLIRAKIHTHHHNKRAKKFFEGKSLEIISLSTLISDFSEIILKMEEENNNSAEPLLPPNHLFV